MYHRKAAAAPVTRKGISLILIVIIAVEIGLRETPFLAKFESCVDEWYFEGTLRLSFGALILRGPRSGQRGQRSGMERCKVEFSEVLKKAAEKKNQKKLAQRLVQVHRHSSH